MNEVNLIIAAGHFAPGRQGRRCCNNGFPGLPVIGGRAEEKVVFHFLGRSRMRDCRESCLEEEGSRSLRPDNQLGKVAWVRRLRSV